MATLRELKGRIGSVASTEKTTSAMKMISSAKMHKATGMLQRLKPYRGIVHNVLSHLLVTDVEFSSPLIDSREVKSVAVVAYGSDDGLCGAFNVNIFKKLLIAIDDLRKQYGKDVKITIIPVGKKIAKAVSKIAAGNLKVENVEYMNTRSTQEQITDFTELLRSRFVDHVYDRVDLAYMRYVSTSRQVMTQEQLLPLSAEALAKDVDPKAACSPCIFEPDANSIFNSVLPLHLRASMQEIFISSTASEQASRVMAMQTASDNAAELLEELNLEYNKLRQQSITTELLDILGGQVER